MADDDELIRALHAEHGDALFAHALRLCDGDRQRAEDLVQETLLRAWRHPEALDPGARVGPGVAVHHCPPPGHRRLAATRPPGSVR